MKTYQRLIAKVKYRNKRIIDDKEYYTLTTDEQGIITADLTEGLYKAVEVQAPDKYNLKGQEYYFGIGASREIPEEMVPEMVQSFKSNNNKIFSVSATSDGGYVAGGYFSGDEIQVEILV